MLYYKLFLDIFKKKFFQNYVAAGELTRCGL